MTTPTVRETLADWIDEVRGEPDQPLAILGRVAPPVEALVEALDLTTQAIDELVKRGAIPRDIRDAINMARKMNTSALALFREGE